MKRTFTLAIVLMSFLAAADAQTLAEKIKSGFRNTIRLIDQDASPTGVHMPWDLYAAPKLGLAVSNLTTMDGKVAFGVTGGAYIEVFILPELAIDMELTYSHQGANDVPRTSETTGYREHDFKLDYINSTYLCRWYPIRERPLSIYSGLHMARLVNAKRKVSGKTYNIYDDLRHGDVAIPVGVSYEWKQWQADVRYNQYFRHIASSQDAKGFLDNTCNTMIDITVAYKILLW